MPQECIIGFGFQTKACLVGGFPANVPRATLLSHVDRGEQVLGKWPVASFTMLPTWNLVMSFQTKACSVVGSSGKLPTAVASFRTAT